MNHIVAIPALKDNYIWAIHSLDKREVAVVDPGDATPVLEYLKENKLTLSAIFITHHHWDHTGGVKDLVKHFKHIPVYGSSIEKVSDITHPVAEGDEIFLSTFPLRLKVIQIPGHTLDHLAYLSDTGIFCGDTLFSCGCGRIFEGTPTQMYHSLEKIKQLSKEMLVYCGHEYTIANIRFAEKVDPHNAHLKRRLENANNLLKKGLPSLPVTLGEELNTNPFLRCNEQDIIEKVEQHVGSKLNTPLDIFTHLRQWKDTF